MAKVVLWVEVLLRLAHGTLNLTDVLVINSKCSLKDSFHIVLSFSLSTKFTRLLQVSFQMSQYYNECHSCGLQLIFNSSLSWSS